MISFSLNEWKTHRFASKREFPHANHLFDLKRNLS